MVSKYGVTHLDIQHLNFYIYMYNVMYTCHMYVIYLYESQVLFVKAGHLYIYTCKGMYIWRPNTEWPTLTESAREFHVHIRHINDIYTWHYICVYVYNNALVQHTPCMSYAYPIHICIGHTCVWRMFIWHTYLTLHVCVMRRQYHTRLVCGTNTYVCGTNTYVCTSPNVLEIY